MVWFGDWSRRLEGRRGSEVLLAGLSASFIVASGAVKDVAHVPLGSIATPEGRMLVFPNCHVHTLSPMSVRQGTGTATRRVIVFWLIHPAHPIKGLAEVPHPQDEMTFEQACEARLELMEERRRYKQSQNVRAVSLCEH